jgi:RNA polymerase sigma-70 factor (ECF subfamily)
MLAAERSDEELMAAYAAGDKSAFHELFRRTAPMLLRVARRKLGEAADADDAVQQTFLQVHRARDDFEPGMKWRPWIVTITLNLCRDALRRRGRWQMTDVDDVPLTAPDVVGTARDAADEATRVRQAVARLPADQREVIELHWFEEMAFNDIAQIVGAKPGAVRVRAHRGYEKLRQWLGGGNVPAMADVP